MAEVETQITIKLTECELIELQNLLSLHYQQQEALGFKPKQRDILNGIFFAINGARRT